MTIAMLFIQHNFFFFFGFLCGMFTNLPLFVSICFVLFFLNFLFLKFIFIYFTDGGGGGSCSRLVALMGMGSLS